MRCLDSQGHQAVILIGLSMICDENFRLRLNTCISTCRTPSFLVSAISTATNSVIYIASDGIDWDEVGIEFKWGWQRPYSEKNPVNRTWGFSLAWRVLKWSWEAATTSQHAMRSGKGLDHTLHHTSLRYELVLGVWIRSDTLNWVWISHLPQWDLRQLRWKVKTASCNLIECVTSVVIGTESLVGGNHNLIRCI